MFCMNSQYNVLAIVIPTYPYSKIRTYITEQLLTWFTKKVYFYAYICKWQSVAPLFNNFDQFIIKTYHTLFFKLHTGTAKWFHYESNFRIRTAFQLVMYIQTSESMNKFAFSLGQQRDYNNTKILSPLQMRFHN